MQIFMSSFIRHSMLIFINWLFFVCYYSSLHICVLGLFVLLLYPIIIGVCISIILFSISSFLVFIWHAFPSFNNHRAFWICFLIFAFSVSFSCICYFLFHQEEHPSMRRVVVQEIVTTEHEYIHDLEALMQVVQLAPSRPGGSQGVHLPSLLGNIADVRCCLPFSFMFSIS